jgi:hypothetical protein
MEHSTGVFVFFQVHSIRAVKNDFLGNGNLCLLGNTWQAEFFYKRNRHKKRLLAQRGGPLTKK